MTISVLVADDQTLVRTGFRMILDSEADMLVVGEAVNGREAVEFAKSESPDVVLMDVRMPVMDGLEATREIVGLGPRAPRVLMLTTFDLDEYVYEALCSGASGFLLKDVPPEQLVAGVRAVNAGESLLAPTVTRRLIEAHLADRRRALARADHLRDLTSRELDVLRLVAEGLSNAEIAARLYLSTATVKTHVAHVLAKLGLRDRVQAVVLAYESGIVTPGEA